MFLQVLQCAITFGTDFSTHGVLHLSGILVYLRHLLKRYDSSSKTPIWGLSHAQNLLDRNFRGTDNTNSNPNRRPRVTPETPSKSSSKISKNLTSIFFRFIDVFEHANHHAHVELAKFTHLRGKIISIRQVVPKIRNILLYSHILEKVPCR